MRLFSPLYERTLTLAQHRHASRYLAGLSFAESSFFPVPPDVMLAPMCLADNQKAIRYATITTLFSVLGGILGYLIGLFAIDLVEPLIQEWGYQQTYQHARDWFAQWGVWVVFLAGFSPIPYKIFTIAAGAASMPFLPFLLASAVGRGARFYIVALLIKWGGPRMQDLLHRYVEMLGWLLIAVAVIIYFTV